MANSDVNPGMKVEYMKEILANQKFVQTFYPQIDTLMQNLYTAHPEDSLVAYNHAVFLVQSARPEKGLDILKDNIKRYPEERNPSSIPLSALLS